MDAMTTAVAEPAEPVGFSGRLGSYLGMAIGNFLLTIVTLGIYRFWAKTKVRRHLWERTTFQGEPLEYRGRGIEKFIGALIVFAVLIVPLFLFGLLSAALTASGNKEWALLFALPLDIGLLWLFGVGMYRSQRYMFSRTAWRGIRGGMVNGGWLYGWTFLKYTLLQVVTLGFSGPYSATRLWNLRMNDAMFGSAEVHADAQWRPVYKDFLIAWLGALVIYGTAFFLVFTQFSDLIAVMKPGAPPPADPKALAAAVIKVYGVLIGAAFVASFLMIRYHAMLLRELFGKTRLDTLGFRFDATGLDLFKFQLANIGLLIVTFGLVTMVMPFRIWRFYTAHLATVGHLDADSLQQTTLAGPSQGDGIADAFDAAAF